MKKLILILIAAIIIVTGCTTHNTDPKIEKWDNTKYEQFSSSVGIDVFNEHSFNEPANSNKINRTLYISDPTKPITVKFNNNGKDRDFVQNEWCS